jgi:hypothetical protein
MAKIKNSKSNDKAQQSSTYTHDQEAVQRNRKINHTLSR